MRRLCAAAMTGVVVAVLSGCAADRQSEPELEPYRIAVPQTQLTPPPYTVNVNEPSGQPGYVFLNNGGINPAAAVLKPGAGLPQMPPPSGPGGPEIVDKQGRVVWFGQLPMNKSAANFRVQTYRGEPVLTWWQGDEGGKDVFGHGNGVDYIVDSHYRVIATLSPEGLTSDVHEFRLTPDGHALITSYKKVPADLSAVGGPKNGQVWDCLASVVDVATKKTVFQLSALAHLPIADSVITTANRAAYLGDVFDAFHMNSIAPTPDGDLLISLRHTSAVYKVSRKTGDIVWQLGGKRSTFALDPGVQFGFQHDAEFTDPQTIRLFNNNADGATTLGPTSLQWIHIDPAARRAGLVRNQTHPGDVHTFAMGNAQAVSDGNTFSGWGTGQHISEFSPSGRLVYDAQTPKAATYRAFLDDWTGEPTLPPELTVQPGDRPTVTAFWNGATEVKQWRVLRGDSATDLQSVTTGDWNGVATALPLPPSTPTQGYFQVQALDESGTVIGESEPTRN